MSQNKKSGTRIKGGDGYVPGSPRNMLGSLERSHQPTAKGAPAEKPPSNPPNKGSAGKK